MKRIFVASAMVMLLFSIPLTAGTVYFTQVAVGGGFTTAFTILNPTSNAETGTLKFRDADGNPWNISMKGGNTDSQFPLSILQNGSARFVAYGTENIETGWAVLESSADLQGVATFDNKPGSVLLDSVGVFGTSPADRFIMPAYTSPSDDVGIAIVNPGNSAVEITGMLRDERGNIFAMIGPWEASPLSNLGANKYLSLFASELFPVLLSKPFKGTLIIEVTGPGSIAVMALSYKEGQVSIIPVLASSKSPT